MERIRWIDLALPLPGNLAVGADRAGFEFSLPGGRIAEAQLYLRSTGSTSGNTDVDVNVNGASILTAPGLRIAQGSATKRVRVTPPGATGEPSGFDIKAGDYITVDIDAVPGTTSADGIVHLKIAVKDTP